jgi:hypothetical protein
MVIAQQEEYSTSSREQGNDRSTFRFGVDGSFGTGIHSEDSIEEKLHEAGFTYERSLTWTFSIDLWVAWNSMLLVGELLGGSDHVKLSDNQVELDTGYAMMNLWLKREVSLVWSNRLKLLPGVAIGKGYGNLDYPYTDTSGEKRAWRVLHGTGMTYSIGLALQYEVISYRARIGRKARFTIGLSYTYRHAKLDDVNVHDQNVPLSFLFRNQDIEIDLSGHMFMVVLGLGLK